MSCAPEKVAVSLSIIGPPELTLDHSLYEYKYLLRNETTSTGHREQDEVTGAIGLFLFTTVVQKVLRILYLYYCTVVGLY